MRRVSVQDFAEDSTRKTVNIRHKRCQQEVCTNITIAQEERFRVECLRGRKIA